MTIGTHGEWGGARTCCTRDQSKQEGFPLLGQHSIPQTSRGNPLPSGEQLRPTSLPPNTQKPLKKTWGYSSPLRGKPLSTREMKTVFILRPPRRSPGGAAARTPHRKAARPEVRADVGRAEVPALAVSRGQALPPGQRCCVAPIATPAVIPPPHLSCRPAIQATATSWGDGSPRTSRDTESQVVL